MNAVVCLGSILNLAEVLIQSAVRAEKIRLHLDSKKNIFPRGGAPSRPPVRPSVIPIGGTRDLHTFLSPGIGQEY